MVVFSIGAGVSCWWSVSDARQVRINGAGVGHGAGGTWCEVWSNVCVV